MTIARAPRALGVAVALAAATLFTTWGLLFYRPLPTIDGHYRLLGLHERGEVIRDVFGIPRIYARDTHDLFFLQGYVTAQDRLAQMEALRASAGAPGDPVVPDDVRSAAEAYVAGVNKFISQHADARALPGELVLAGRRPTPWTSRDVIRIAAGNLRPSTRCISVPRELSVKGQRLFAADVYFEGDAPGWYEVGLDGGGARAIGISLPGVPGIVAGHNAWVAWAPLDRALDPLSTLEGSISALASRNAADVRSSRSLCGADVHGAQLGQLAVAASARVDLESARSALGLPARSVGARLLIDLADVDTSRSAVSHGASGHRASPHYDDQKALWEIGQTHRLPFTRGAIGRTDGELVLRAR